MIQIKENKNVEKFYIADVTCLARLLRDNRTAT